MLFEDIISDSGLFLSLDVEVRESLKVKILEVSDVKIIVSG